MLCSQLGNMGGDPAKGIHHQTDRDRPTGAMLTTARAEVSGLGSEETARAEREKGGEKGECGKQTLPWLWGP